MGRSRVVITGMGAVTPLGLDPAALCAGLRSRRSGIRVLRAYDPSALPVRIGGELEGFDPRNYVDRKDRKSLKIMSRTVQLAVAAARQAADDSAILTSGIAPNRLGVVLGSSTVPGDLAELGAASKHSLDPTTKTVDLRVWGQSGMQLMQPMWMLMHVPNMAACHISILHDARGPNNTITQNDVASLMAFGEAVRTIERGAADAMLAGGADTRVPTISLVRYALFSQLSRRNEDPERACRPFDRDRDGQVLSEGAGVLVLEELEHARRRNARIHGEIVGYAAAFDRGRTGTGLARAVRQALAEADITPADLDHVNAHATGTTEDDAWEAQGLAASLGESVPVVGLKGSLGNLGAAGGAVEVIGSLMPAAGGWRPGTLNHENPDPACPVNVAVDEAAARRPFVLKVSCTELGHCAALVIRRWE